MGLFPRPLESQHLKMAKFFEVLLVFSIALIAMADARAQIPSDGAVSNTGNVGGNIQDTDNSYNTASTTNIRCHGDANCLGTNYQQGTGPVFAHRPGKYLERTVDKVLVLP